MIIVVEVKYFLEDFDNNTPSHFAFLDTVYNKFLEFDGTHIWDSWADFISYCGDEKFQDRVKGLCPKWVFKNEDR